MRLLHACQSGLALLYDGGWQRNVPELAREFLSIGQPVSDKLLESLELCGVAILLIEKKPCEGRDRIVVVARGILRPDTQVLGKLDVSERRRTTLIGRLDELAGLIL